MKQQIKEDIENFDKRFKDNDDFIFQALSGEVIKAKVLTTVKGSSSFFAIAENGHISEVAKLGNMLTINEAKESGLLFSDSK